MFFGRDLFGRRLLQKCFLQKASKLLYGGDFSRRGLIQSEPQTVSSVLGDAKGYLGVQQFLVMEAGALYLGYSGGVLGDRSLGK